MRLFDFLKPDPGKHIRRQIQAKMQQAVQLQRNGKIAQYSTLMGEVDSLQKQLDAVSSKE